MFVLLIFSRVDRLGGSLDPCNYVMGIGRYLTEHFPSNESKLSTSLEIANKPFGQKELVTRKELIIKGAPRNS